MGTLNSEMLRGGCFIDEHDARTEIIGFIEGCYNTHRKHSSIDYRTPAQFEASMNTRNQPNNGSNGFHFTMGR